MGARCTYQQVHSRVKSHGRKVTYHLPSLINARIRRSELVKSLGDGAFFAFASGAYRSRLLIRRVLGFSFPASQRWKLQTMTQKQLREHLYMYSMEAQTQDLVGVMVDGSTVQEATKVLMKPTIVERSPIQFMLVDFAKDQLEMEGVTWSVPAAFFTRTVAAAVPDNLTQCAMAAPRWVEGH